MASSSGTTSTNTIFSGDLNMIPIPLVDLPVAQQLLDISRQEDLEDMTILLQKQLQANVVLGTLLNPALGPHQWDPDKQHFKKKLSSQSQQTLQAYFTKVMERASEANTDTVMEEVAQHTNGPDQIMRALTLSAAQNIIDLTHKRSAISVHLDILTAAGPPQDQQAIKHRAMHTAALEDLAAAIRLSLQQYKLEDGSPLYEARKTFFLLIAQSKECEEQLQMIEGNDEPACKKLHDQWTHVNQQMAQTETNIYNLLQSPDSNLDSTIKAQQEEVLRQQQVLVDQRASMDWRLAVAIGVSPAKKKAKGFYPDRVPDTPPNIIPPPPPKHLSPCSGHCLLWVLPGQCRCCHRHA